MAKPKPEHDHDPANDNGGATTPANDNGGAITPASNASTALTALTAAFKTVDVTTIGRRPVLPLLLYKSRENKWTVGRQKTVIEPNSLWAINPSTFQWGWVCFDSNNKPLGETLVSVSKPLPDVTKLQDTGFPWQPQMAVNLKCISGVDAGAEVVFKTNTEGGKGEVLRVIEAVGDRLTGQHGGKVAPIVQLESSSYGHQQYGKTWVPVLTLVDWMSLDGPASPPPPPPYGTESTAPEQPRRRRVG
jgi:hypothetical protein